MWEFVAEQIQEKGAEIRLNSRAEKLNVAGNNVTSVVVVNDKTGLTETIQADYVFSTMPMKELVQKMETTVPANVKEVAEGLLYRDFITVGLLLSELTIKEENAHDAAKLITDNWIYIQEPDVKLGRFANPSITGALILLLTKAKSGSVWNIFATIPTICGRGMTRK